MCLYDKKGKKQLEVENDKKAMINQIDVEYRDIQDIDNQYHIMSTILNCFNDEQLKAILKLTKS